jgi:prepilin-type N-terminal cleavage/methylation domain-containing protein
MKSDNGFTFIELLIVLAILCILISIGASKFNESHYNKPNERSSYER